MPAGVCRSTNSPIVRSDERVSSHIGTWPQSSRTSDSTPGISRRSRGAWRSGGSTRSNCGVASSTGQAMRSRSPSVRPAVGAQGLDRPLGDRAAERGLHQAQRVARRHALAARMMSRSASRRTFGRRRTATCAAERARHAHLAREEACQPPRLAVARRPAAGGRERDDRARATALCQLERQRAAHRVADDVRRAHAELVEVRLQRVGRAGERHRAAQRIRASRRRGRAASARSLRSARRGRRAAAPVHPRAGEAVQQYQRLARACAIQGWRHLSHGPISVPRAVHIS